MPVLNVIGLSCRGKRGNNAGVDGRYLVTRGREEVSAESGLIYLDRRVCTLYKLDLNAPMFITGGLNKKNASKIHHSYEGAEWCWLIRGSTQVKSYTGLGWDEEGKRGSNNTCTRNKLPHTKARTRASRQESTPADLLLQTLQATERIGQGDRNLNLKITPSSIRYLSLHTSSSSSSLPIEIYVTWMPSRVTVALEYRMLKEERNTPWVLP